MNYDGWFNVTGGKRRIKNLEDLYGVWLTINLQQSGKCDISKGQTHTSVEQNTESRNRPI